MATPHPLYADVTLPKHRLRWLAALYTRESSWQSSRKREKTRGMAYGYGGIRVAIQIGHHYYYLSKRRVLVPQSTPRWGCPIVDVICSLQTTRAVTKTISSTTTHAPNFLSKHTGASLMATCAMTNDA